MKDQNKDRFETFLHESLQTYGEDPSDQVWEKLEPNIPQPESKKRPFFGWFAMLAIVLLFFGGYWLKYNANMEKVQQVLHEQEVQLENISKEIEKINNDLKQQKINNSTSQITQPLKEKTQQKTTETITVTTKQNNYNNKVTASQDPIKSYTTTLSNIISNSFVLDKPKQEKPQSSVSIIDKIEPSSEILKSKLETLTSIPSIFGDLKTSERVLNQIDPVDIIGPPKKASFEFYNYWGTNYPDINLQSPISNFGRKDARNFDLGILYNIPLNQRWQLQIGLGYTRRSIGSNFENSFFYSDNELLINPNTFESNSTLILNSNYGRQILTNHFLNSKMNDGLDIEAGDAYSANISIVRTQEYVNVPLLIKYNWSDPYRKLKWTVKAGIIDRIYFKVNNPGEVTFSQISHPRLQHNYTEVENVGYGNTATRFGLEIALGAGVEYEFNKNFTLIFEPMFKTNIWERTPVNPYSLGIYSGVRWTFKR